MAEKNKNRKKGKKGLVGGFFVKIGAMLVFVIILLIYYFMVSNSDGSSEVIMSYCGESSLYCYTNIETELTGFLKAPAEYNERQYSLADLFVYHALHPEELTSSTLTNITTPFFRKYGKKDYAEGCLIIYDGKTGSASGSYEPIIWSTFCPIFDQDNPDNIQGAGGVVEETIYYNKEQGREIKVFYSSPMYLLLEGMKWLEEWKES